MNLLEVSPKKRCESCAVTWNGASRFLHAVKCRKAAFAYAALSGREIPESVGKRVCKRVEPKALEGERVRLDPQLVLLTFFVAKGFGSELNPRC